MAVFAYRGRSTSGTVSGQIEADDRPAAVAQLRARGIVATSVQERQAKAAAVKKVGGKVKDKDLAIYTRQFSTMVDAGLPIAQCLAILAEQGDSKALRDVTGKIAREVEGGATLAESFRKYPKVFNDLFTNMLQVGESGGVLDIVLQRLSGYIEKAAKLKAAYDAGKIPKELYEKNLARLTGSVPVVAAGAEPRSGATPLESTQAPAEPEMDPVMAEKIKKLDKALADGKITQELYDKNVARIKSK